MKKTLIYILIFVSLIVVSIILYNNLKDNIDTNSMPAPPSQEDQSDVKAADFTVYDKDGNAVKLSDFIGKPVIINFWASWCSPCKSEMPHFDEVYKELGDEVVFMMIDMVDNQRETVQKGKTYIEDAGYQFPVYYDTDQDAAYTYGIYSIPTSIFIDAQGNIITGANGMINKELLMEGINMININDLQDKPRYTVLSPAEAKGMMEEMTAGSFKIIDVRTEEEFNEGYIKDAILIPDEEITEKITSVVSDKDTPIFIYCNSGVRSEDAARELVKLGYSKVYDFGGIIDWPYDIVK